MSVRNTPKIKILLLYTLVGPVIGGLFSFAYAVATIFVPHMMADPHNQFGHGRIEEFFSTFALTILFSFPFGVLPAAASGTAHVLTMQRFPEQRPKLSFVVCLTAAAAMALELVFLRVDAGWFILIAVASAAVLSLCISRRK